MVNLLARAGVRDQFDKTVRVVKASQAGVPCTNLRTQLARLHNIITVEDGHPARTARAVALEDAISMNQQWPSAGGPRRQCTADRRDHLHSRHFRIGNRVRDRNDRRGFAALSAPLSGTRTVLVRPTSTAPTPRHWHGASASRSPHVPTQDRNRLGGIGNSSCKFSDVMGSSSPLCQLSVLVQGRPCGPRSAKSNGAPPRTPALSLEEGEVRKSADRLRRTGTRGLPQNLPTTQGSAAKIEVA